MSVDLKKVCYRVDCGPIIQTGFSTTYYICKSCKLEISENLAEEINKRKKEKKSSDQYDDDDLLKLFEEMSSSVDDPGSWFI